MQLRAQAPMQAQALARRAQVQPQVQPQGQVQVAAPAALALEKRLPLGAGQSRSARLRGIGKHHRRIITMQSVPARSAMNVRKEVRASDGRDAAAAERLLER